MKQKTQKQNCYEFYAHGMHCAACELFLEKKLSKFKGVESVKAKLKTQKIIVKGDFNTTPSDLAEKLTLLVKEDGYELSLEKKDKKINWSQFYYAIPIAFAIMSGFIILQKLGVVNLVNASQMNYPAVFLIGVIASLSSCMAVVGGLVLSIAASYSKEENRKKSTTSQIMFHIGRIVGFFILGGVIGIIGKAFTLSSTTSFALSMVVGFVMIILGLNLLDIFGFTKKLQFKMPKFISAKVLKNDEIKNDFAPILLGIVTFFLPCGFTQSMQIYSLSTGSFLNGALTMLVFALGTFPVLALISFSSVNLAKSVKSGIFFKTAGIVVLAFALLNIIAALTAIGLISPILNF